MSYVPDFENDIFISYTHKDNLPLTEGQKGWIDVFHHHLKVRLAQLLGADPEIWRDPKLQGNDFLTDAIITKLPKVAVLLTVLSPGYIQSEWCLRELHKFYEASQETGGVRVDNRSRIFKVVKTHLKREEFPGELQDMNGYEFYREEPKTGRKREFYLETGQEIDMLYLGKLDDLAHDISELLKGIRNLRGGFSTSAPGRPDITVYLAETTSDLSDDRDRIRRELQQRGYGILPDRPLPLNAEKLNAMVKDFLNRSNLSVHPVGAYYGVVPEGETRSLVCIQNELAAGRSGDPSFSRLIFMPVGLTAKEGRQEEYVRHIQYDADALRGAELLQTTIEDLKTIILDKVMGRLKPQEKPLCEEGPPRIYLICDQRDFDATESLYDYLFDQGFDVSMPSFEGDEAEVRQAHQNNLLLCDAVIVYYGSASDSWVSIKMSDLQKVFGYGRQKPMRAKAVFIGAPETKPKQRYQSREALVIRNFGAFTPGVLTGFLAQLRSGKGR
jgi:hypothetical protein